MRVFTMAPMALLFAAAPALAQAPAWHVSEVSGVVRIVESGRARPATRGALLSSGAIVATGPQARAVLVRGRDYVIVSPASQVRVPTAQQQGPRGLIQMVTDAGTAMFRIEHQANPHFGVGTPYLAAVVKGTVFTVTVRPEGASVQVTEGAVDVSTVDGGAADTVRPGMVAMVSAGDLRLLHVEGETSRSIRSNGTPLAGVVTVPAGEAGRYIGPAERPAAIHAPVAEAPVPLADATDGLVSGSAGLGDRAAASLRDATRPARGHGGHGQGGDGHGANDNSGPGNNNGGGSDNSGSGNNNGGGSDNSGSGSNNGGSSDNGGSGSTNGGGSDNSGSGSGNSGSGSDNSGSGSDSSGSGSGSSGSGSDNSGSGSDNSGSGSGSSGSGSDNSGSGSDNSGNSGSGSGSDGGLHVCLPGDLLCVGLGGRRGPNGS